MTTRLPLPFLSAASSIIRSSVHTTAEKAVSVSTWGVNASPTILNNIIVNTVTGLQVDSSSSSTVIGSNLFLDNGSNGTVGNDPLPDPLTSSTPLFVGADVYNFYLASGSAAIDSGTEGLGYRTGFQSVKDSMGIPVSPVITPERDRYYQKRLDDPSQPSSGSGTDAFKDRGAIERADFTGPTARVVDPRRRQAASR